MTRAMANISTDNSVSVPVGIVYGICWVKKHSLILTCMSKFFHKILRTSLILLIFIYWNNQGREYNSLVVTVLLSVSWHLETTDEMNIRTVTDCPMSDERKK